MPVSLYIPMALGVVFSLVVGIGLMALMFYSSRKGYDEPPDRESPLTTLLLTARSRTTLRIACMPITRDEVAHLARLSRIALSDAELDHLAPQLDQIITAVAQVQEVAAEGIPPTSHATGLTNVYRDDEPGPCLTPAEALDQAPAVEQQRFKVPRILGED